MLQFGEQFWASGQGFVNLWVYEAEKVQCSVEVSELVMTGDVTEFC